MQGRGKKIKSKAVSETLSNPDVLDMFHGVLGTSEGGADITIIYPKYLRMRNHVERFLKVLDVLHTSKLMADLFPGDREEIGRYLDVLRGQCEASFCAPSFAYWIGEPSADAVALAEKTGLSPYQTDDYAKVPVEAVKQFKHVFGAVKKCSLVNTVIVTCKNLVAHKKSLEDASKLRDRFLTKMGGTVFCPLPDLALNFRKIYIDDRLGPEDRRFVLALLHKLYMVGHDLYEAVTSPDIDVNVFVDVIMDSVAKVRGQIAGCNEAFNKILESVDLLKSNFGSYNKDYVSSGNASIIMENFVLDVSKNTNATPKVTMQFRKIISHYRKVAAQQPQNPKLASLFNQVDANFAELSKKSKAADETPLSESEEAEVATDDAATRVVTEFPGDAAPGEVENTAQALTGLLGQAVVLMDEGGLAEELDAEGDQG